MSQLEELTLYIRITNGATFITGTHLDNEILIHMPQLHTFTFYITSETVINNPVIRVSSDDIQQTFTNIKNRQIFCMVDYLADLNIICRVFSIPFKFHCLEDFTNNIPDIVFNSVTHLKLWDKDPFKHEFFVRLARAFPFLKYLIIWNIQQPFWRSDEFELLKKDWHSIVEYPHLILIDIESAHIHYVEHFLNETKTRLPCLTQLNIKYNDLEKVTKNFTRAETRHNCARVKRLIVEGPIVYSKDVYHYFPLLSFNFVKDNI
jgi:hypothetical protein